MTMNLDDWYDHLFDNDKLIKLDDIINLPTNQELEVLFLDRNFFDLCPTGESVNIFQNIHKFYRGKYNKHNSDSLIGSFEFYPNDDWEGKFYSDFEFDCKEVGTRMYWPFQNDKLNTLANYWRFYEGEEGFRTYRRRVEEECKHYLEIDKNSLVGWRGPMIELNKVALLPNINTN